MSHRPEGKPSRRDLHFIWICDCSGSMSVRGKIQSLNHAIRESIRPMQEAARENPFANVLVRALAFSSGAHWQVADPTPIDKFLWSDLQADEGNTELGRALSMVAEQLHGIPVSERGLPPALVLISDGQPTDNYSAGLKALLAEPWGQRAVRIAVAIGQDADLEVLQKFIGRGEQKPLQANNAEELVRQIHWASTSVLKAASEPLARTGATGGPVLIPGDAPGNSPATGANAVW